MLASHVNASLDEGEEKKIKKKFSNDYFMG